MTLFGIENDNYIAGKNEILTFRIKNDNICYILGQDVSIKFCEKCKGLTFR